MKKHMAILFLLFLFCAVTIPCISYAAVITELTVSVSVDTQKLSETNMVDLEVAVQLDTGIIGNEINMLSVTCQNVSTIKPDVVYYGKSTVFHLNDVPIKPEQYGKPIPVELLYIDLDGLIISNLHYFTVSPQNENTETISISRMVEPMAPKSGEIVHVLFLVNNTGHQDATDVRIEDTAFGTVAQFQNLGAGQQQSVDTTFIMPNENIVSQGQLEYINAAGESIVSDYQPLEIKRQRFALSITASTDTASVQYGDSFWLSCTVRNSGRIAYSDVSMECDHLEDLPVIDKLMPGESYVYGRWITPSTSRTYSLEVSGTDESGERYTVSAAPITVGISQGILLDERVRNIQSDIRTRSVTLNTDADQTKVFPNEIVSFEITIRHPISLINDIVIRENSLGEIDRIQMLPSGDHLFKYSIPIDHGGEYQFSLSGKDEKGISVLALSEPIEITLLSNETSQVTSFLSPASLANDNEHIVDTGTLVLYCIGGLMLLSAVLLIWLIRRERIAKQ